MSTKQVAKSRVVAVRRGKVPSTEVARKIATHATKRAATKLARGAAANWLAFRDAILDEPPAARIAHIRAGAEAGFLAGAAEMLGVSRETIFKLVGLPVATANRKIAKRETLEPAVTERLARLAVIERLAEDTFGDPDMAKAWLRADNLGLGSCTPLSMLDTDIGCREVSKILVAIGYGGTA